MTTEGVLGMSQKIKNIIEVRYQFSDVTDYQEKLDDIFDFIFEETISQIRLDSIQEQRSNYTQQVGGAEK